MMIISTEIPPTTKEKILMIFFKRLEKDSSPSVLQSSPPSSVVLSTPLHTLSLICAFATLGTRTTVGTIRSAMAASDARNCFNIAFILITFPFVILKVIIPECNGVGQVGQLDYINRTIDVVFLAGAGVGAGFVALEITNRTITWANNTTTKPITA